MVRLLLVRHAESVHQARLFHFSQRVERGEIESMRRAFDIMAELRLSEDINGDPPLSDNGEEQARLFAAYWEPILLHKAQEGKLFIYVSPHVRTLQTADPFVQQLRSRVGPRLRATVNADLFEVYGITMHPMDRGRLMQRMRELGRLGPDGLLPKGVFDERPELLPEDFDWTRGGLSANEMRLRFEWLDVASGAFGSAHDDAPWFRGRPETPQERDVRTVRVVEWLEQHARERSPNDVLVIFTHGELTGRVLNMLFAKLFGVEAASSGKVPNRKDMGGRGWLGLDPGSNTSTSLLTLTDGELPRLEFFHRLDHLGPETKPDTLMLGYQSLGFANGVGKLQSASNPVGKWGVRETITSRL